MRESDLIFKTEAFKWVNKANKNATRPVLQHFLIDTYGDEKVLIASDSFRIHMVFENALADISQLETGLYQLTKNEKGKTEKFVKTSDENLKYPDWRIVVPLGCENESKWQKHERTFIREFNCAGVVEMSYIMCHIYKACPPFMCFNYKYLEDILEIYKINKYVETIETAIWTWDDRVSLEVKCFGNGKLLGYGYLMGMSYK